MKVKDLVKDEAIEVLSKIEHEQWMGWAKALLKDGEVSEERAARWKKLFVPYEELTNKSKDDDREYAKKAYAALNKMDP